MGICLFRLYIRVLATVCWRFMNFSKSIDGKCGGTVEFIIGFSVQNHSLSCRLQLFSIFRSGR